MVGIVEAKTPKAEEESCRELGKKWPRRHQLSQSLPYSKDEHINQVSSLNCYVVNQSKCYLHIKHTGRVWPKY